MNFSFFKRYPQPQYHSKDAYVEVYDDDDVSTDSRENKGASQDSIRMMAEEQSHSEQEQRDIMPRSMVVMQEQISQRQDQEQQEYPNHYASIFSRYLGRPQPNQNKKTKQVKPNLQKKHKNIQKKSKKKALKDNINIFKSPSSNIKIQKKNGFDFRMKIGAINKMVTCLNDTLIEEQSLMKDNLAILPEIIIDRKDKINLLVQKKYNLMKRKIINLE